MLRIPTKLTFTSILEDGNGELMTLWGKNIKLEQFSFDNEWVVAIS